MSDAAGPLAAVSVIITTYDDTSFLESALRSAAAQTLPAAEIIVVDDGSRDHPESVTDRFPEVRLIRQANAGLSAARNTGWRAATSEFVVFLDADDRLLPEALRVNAERLLAHPEAGFAYGAYVDVYALEERRRFSELVPAPDGFAAFLRGNVVGMHGAVMYRRAMLAEIGGFENGLAACEDYDVYLRMASRFPVLYGDARLAEYWHHGTNMSRDSAMMLRHALFVLRRQRSEAGSLAEQRAYRKGIAHLKRHYVRAWGLEVLQRLGSRSLEPSLLPQGASLARQAPLTMLIAPLRALRQLAHRGQGWNL